MKLLSAIAFGLFAMFALFYFLAQLLSCLFGWLFKRY